MKLGIKYMLYIFLFFIFKTLWAEDLNIFTWGGEIPSKVIRQFEKESKIKVNLSTFDSNETLYAKLKSLKNDTYDIITPSSYFVERMYRQGLLAKLDKSKLINFDSLDPFLLNRGFDPYNNYSIPYVWGATGIFFNKKYIKEPITLWKQLWDTKWKNKLLLLDDSREVFSMSLLSLSLSPNSQNLNEIKKSFHHLSNLLSNIKLFASDTIKVIMIDEDALIGMSWNGDAYKAIEENSNLSFVFPQDGFVIWIDCLSIPKNAPHKKSAYRFLNFLLRADIAKQVALIEGHAIANLKGRQLLPTAIQQNTIVYPDKDTLERGVFQKDISKEALSLYGTYWQQLKLLI
jgi:spermidine/putrescine transport system substrate-binding protein